VGAAPQGVGARGERGAAPPVVGRVRVRTLQGGRVSAEDRAAERRRRWAAEARRDLIALWASAPPKMESATRARAVLKLARSVMMPEDWAVMTAYVAFSLPPGIGEATEMDAPGVVGLRAAADFVRVNNVPCAQAFADKVAAHLGQTLSLDFRQAGQVR